MPHKSLLLIALIVLLLAPVSGAPPQTITLNVPITQPAPSATVASASTPSDLASTFDDQLNRLLSGQPTLAEPNLAALAPEDRELLTTLIQGISTFRQSTRSATTLDEKTRPLLELSSRLKDRANLAISNVTLCNSVDRFGTYEPLTSKDLPANTETPAILYCEIDNFHSKPNGKGFFETHLTYELALYSDSSSNATNPIFSKPSTPVIDRCRTRRRDFFLADRVTFPATLPAGRYLLKVTITDAQAHRIGEATLPITVAARP